MFWMNGLMRHVDTVELFSLVRSLPDPVPTEMVVWASPTSALACSGSEWSAVLKMNLLALLSEIYEHHEPIIRQQSAIGGEDIDIQEGIRIFRSCCDGISELIAFSNESPLSVWTSEDEGLEDSVAYFSVTQDPCFQKVMMLPHVQKILKNAEMLSREFQRKANRNEANFNRFTKLLK